MPGNTAEYNRAYWLAHGHGQTKRERIQAELDKALECLTDEFNAAQLSGTAGLRAQAIAHVRQARLILLERQEVKSPNERMQRLREEMP